MEVWAVHRILVDIGIPVRAVTLFSFTSQLWSQFCSHDGLSYACGFKSRGKLVDTDHVDTSARGLENSKFALKTLFNIVEDRLKKLLNFNVCVV